MEIRRAAAEEVIRSALRQFGQTLPYDGVLLNETNISKVLEAIAAGLHSKGFMSDQFDDKKDAAAVQQVIFEGLKSHGAREHLSLMYTSAVFASKIYEALEEEGWLKPSIDS